MTQYNHLSDNQLAFRVRTRDGEVIDPHTMWLKVHLQCGGRKFTAVNDPQGQSQHCHIDGDAVIVDIPGKAFYKGEIEYMIEIREDSPYFADGHKNIFPTEYATTNIEMI